MGIRQLDGANGLKRERNWDLGHETMGPWKAKLASVGVRECCGGGGLGRNCYPRAEAPGGQALDSLPTVLIHVCVWAGAASHTGMGVKRKVVGGWLGPTLSGVTHGPLPPF